MADNYRRIQRRDQSSGKRSYHQKKSTSPWKKTLIIAMFAVFGVILVGGGCGFLYASFQDIPDLSGKMPDQAASTLIYDHKGALITSVHAVENRIPVELQQVPKNLQNAFVAVEDNRFYEHGGIDPRGILRAVWVNISGGGLSEGGSTITQQLVKNSLLTQERSLKRKFQEAILSFKVEKRYTKDEILGFYLNQIYFGNGAYGVQAAANTYFGKDVTKLSLAEAALLAGLPKSPNYYSPFDNMKAAKERQATVLDQMVKYGYISENDAAEAKKADLNLTPQRQNNDHIAPYFVDHVIQKLTDEYGSKMVYEGGLKVYTSLDLEMQKAAESAVKNNLPNMGTNDQGIIQPQAALVAIDPSSGEVRAMVGGRGDDFFNRAILAHRQPGSSFKPFTYIAALENGFTPASILEDKTFSSGSWTPRNYDHTTRGDVSLRTALVYSLNIPLVRVADQVGMDKVLGYAQKMGISTLDMANDKNLSSALGGLYNGASPLEIAQAYGVLATNGVKAEPLMILKVVGKNGEVLEEHSPKRSEVLNPAVAYLITDMLKDVVARGTGTAAQIGRPAAGKTGTTDDYKDAWFVGYTPNLVASVWIGKDSGGTLGGISGGSTPAIIWRQFMSGAVHSLPAIDFPRPSGIVSVSVDPIDGLLADEKTEKPINELFLAGTEPKQKTKHMSPTGNKPNDKKDDKATDDKDKVNPPTKPTDPTTNDKKPTTTEEKPKTTAPKTPPVAPKPKEPPPKPKGGSIGSP